MEMQLDCEDASLACAADGWILAAVADGHGSMKHFRSRTGAQLACQAAREAVERLGPDAPPQALEAAILEAWRSKVHAHLAENPWTEEELAGQSALLDEAAFHSLVRGETVDIAYGTTLVCAIVTEAGWHAMQIGDGGIALMDSDGSWSWPMPPCERCHGHYTASMCMADAAAAFRHQSGEGLPAAIVLYSDGVEKSFPPHSLPLARYLHQAASAGEAAALEALAREVAENGGVRDDVSLAVVRTQPLESLPALRESDGQRQLRLQRIASAIRECEGTVAYLRRVMDVCAPEDKAAIAAKLQAKEEALFQLTNALQQEEELP